MQYTTNQPDLVCYGPFEGDDKIKDESKRIAAIVDGCRYNIEQHAEQIGEDPTAAIERFRTSLVPA